MQLRPAPLSSGEHNLHKIAPEASIKHYNSPFKLQYPEHLSHLWSNLL